MPKYTPSPELMERLAEPIEFELAGQEFRLDIVPTSVYAHLAKLDQSEDAMMAFLSAICGKKAIVELGPIDGREAGPLVQWLSGVLTEGLTENQKNTDAE